MDYRGQAKAAMNAKINRLTDEKYVKTDASDWSPPEPLNADVKVGMRPVSRRAYKKGGRVDVKAEGGKAPKRADRASGGKALADAIVNRNVKDANEERDGIKHVGGMKTGGRAKRDLGGVLKTAATAISPAFAVGRMLSGKKNGGRTGKADGGPMMGGPMGGGMGGGAPMGGSPQVAPPGAPMAARQGMGFAKGGKAKAKGKHHKKPHAEPKVNMDALLSGLTPAVGTGGVDMAAPDGAAPGMGAAPAAGLAGGGDVHQQVGEALGHAMAAYHRSQTRNARKSGGRIGRSDGGGFGETMNNPKHSTGGSSKKRGGPTINITINSAPKPMMPPMGAPPMMPPPMPDGGLPPGLAPTMGPPGGGPGPGPGMPPPLLAGGPPPGPPPGMGPKPFKRGGRASMTAGAGGGEGRLEKGDWYGAEPRPGRATGGMTAGAGSGEGRLQKIEAYGEKA